jgi:hypothetical protein
MQEGKKGVMFALEKEAVHRWIIGRCGENTEGRRRRGRGREGGRGRGDGGGGHVT